jgi:hypothetical protein
MIFVTLDDILSSKKILYTNLDYDIGINRRVQVPEESIDPNLDRFKKLSQ